MYSIEHSDVSRMEVLYLNGSHAWIICDDCNQRKIFNWDRYTVTIYMLALSLMSLCMVTYYSWLMVGSHFS